MKFVVTLRLFVDLICLNGTEEKGAAPQAGRLTSFQLSALYQDSLRLFLITALDYRGRGSCNPRASSKPNQLLDWWGSQMCTVLLHAVCVCVSVFVWSNRIRQDGLMGLQLFILCALYQAFNRTHVAIKMLSHRAHPTPTPPTPTSLVLTHTWEPHFQFMSSPK